MHIASIGIDLGKTTFHLVALGERNKVLLRKKFSRPQLLAYTANLPASLIGLEACAGAHFPGDRTTRTRSPGAADPGAVRQTVSEVEQERLHRCRGHRRSRNQAEHALCADQDAGATRLAGHAPRAGSAGAASHCADQRDSRIPAGTRHHFAAQPIHLRKNLPTVIEDAEQNLSPRLRWLLDRHVAGVEADGDRDQGDHRRD